MALTLTQTPEAFSLSGNPVIFEVSTTTTSVDFHKLHVRVTYDGSVVGEDALPVVSGKAQFDISDYLKEEINGHFEISEDYVEYDIIKTYSIVYFETYNNDGQEHGNVTSSTYKVMQGKLDYITLAKMAAASETFFSKYIDGVNIKILSLREEEIIAYKNEDDFIYVYGASGNTFVYYITFTLNDGTTRVKSDEAAASSNNKIYLQPCGYNNFIYPIISGESWKNDVFKYELKYGIEGEGYNFIVHTYYLKETARDYKQLIFKNPFGVYETVYFYGISENETAFDREFSETDEHDKILNGSSKETRIINSGWISEAKYNNLMLLLKSKDTYIIEDGLELPVVITSKKHKRSSVSNLYSVEIEIDFAHTDYF